MKKYIETLRIRIACTRYTWAPDWVWFLFVSPLLAWAIGRKPGSYWWQNWFMWPNKHIK